MPTKSSQAVALDPRIDAYIAKSADFARPILTHLRNIVHEGCPSVQENIKWGMPSFEYKGLLCGIAAFKQHCTFGFWKHDLVVPKPESPGKPARVDGDNKEGMGQFGCIRTLADLPPRRTLLAYVRKATELNDEGIKVPRKPKPPRKPLPTPRDFAAALKKAPGAAGHFANFSNSHRREYIEWILEARTDATRQRRIATAVEWIAEGKSRNWKYERRR
jgi:uncharacterized protein YdeI (YjbR/CyaY-like superfamily)